MFDSVQKFIDAQVAKVKNKVRFARSSFDAAVNVAKKADTVLKQGNQQARRIVIRKARDIPKALQPLGTNLGPYLNAVSYISPVFNPITRKEVINVAQSIPRGAKSILMSDPRMYAVAGLAGLTYKQIAKPQKQSTFTPQSQLDLVLYGNTPITDARTSTIGQGLTKRGVDPKLATSIALAASVLDLGTNVIPGGAEKGAVKSMLSKVAKSKNADEIAKTLLMDRRLSKFVKDIPELSQRLVKEDTPKEVSVVLNKFVGDRAKVITVRTEKNAPMQNVLWENDRPLPKTIKINNQPYANKVSPATTTFEEADNMINSAIYKSQDKRNFNALFDNWIGAREAAKTEGASTAYKLNTPATKAKETISQLESNLKNNKYANSIRSAYDDLFATAEDLATKTDQPIMYRKDYLTHVWKESTDQIAQKMAKLGRKFSFANSRSIPTYKEGVEMGLTPRYSNPASMVGEYVKKLNETKANLEFFNQLRSNGMIVPASVGRRHPDFVQITAPGFPNSSNRIGEDTIIGGWFAPKEIAANINKVFSPQDPNIVGKVLDATARASGMVQDVALAGGVVKTPANFFTVMQMMKEVMAGRLKSPIMSFFRSMDAGTTAKHFAENTGQVKKMLTAGVPWRSNFDIKNVVDEGWLKNTFGEKWDIWNKVANDKTFGAFMPQLQLSFFNDLEKTALRAGKSPEEAIEIAALATKNFYGLGSIGKNAKADKLVKDFWTTFFLAPKYRESMISFWWNNLKALKNPLAIENRANTNFLVGAIITYIAYDQANYALNGVHMKDNPSGKEDKLLIPLKDGYTIGVPYLSSIATVPRSAYKIGKNLYQGDFKQAGKEFGSNFSILFKSGIEASSNQDYFGREIYSESDGAGTKLLKQGAHVAKSAMHPYVEEGINVVYSKNPDKKWMEKYLGAKKQPGYQSASAALEMPFRFYKDNSLSGSEYYANKAKVDKLAKQHKDGKISDADAAAEISKIYQDQKGINEKWGSKYESSAYSFYTPLVLNKLSDEDKKLFESIKDEEPDEWSQKAKAATLLSRPDVLKAKTAIARLSAKEDKKSLDPFYVLSPEKQKIALVYQTLSPGSSDKSPLINANPWIKQYWNARSEYFDNTNFTPQQTSNVPKIEASPALQKKIDLYYTLPSGTGARSALLRANPDIQQYWDKKNAETDLVRKEMGLPALKRKKYGSSGSKKKSKKINVSAVKLKKIKIKKTAFKQPVEERMAVSKLR